MDLPDKYANIYFTDPPEVPHGPQIKKFYILMTTKSLPLSKIALMSSMLSPLDISYKYCKLKRPIFFSPIPAIHISYQYLPSCRRQTFDHL